MRLSSQAAEDARKAGENSGFTPVEAGIYTLRLVDVKPPPGGKFKSGNPGWVWELETVGPSHVGRKHFVRTAFTEAAMWKVSEMFDAFGADTDADTEELIGELCQAEITVEPITDGQRAGQDGNNVARCFPVDGAQRKSAEAASPKPATAEVGW